MCINLTDMNTVNLICLYVFGTVIATALSVLALQTFAIKQELQHIDSQLNSFHDELHTINKEIQVIGGKMSSIRVRI